MESVCALRAARTSFISVLKALLSLATSSMLSPNFSTVVLSLVMESTMRSTAGSITATKPDCSCGSDTDGAAAECRLSLVLALVLVARPMGSRALTGL